MSIENQLEALPDSWGLVAVDGNKHPYQRQWQKRPLDKPALLTELRSGRAKAIGVLCGTPSGGLLFLDHDGESASTVLDGWGYPASKLPKSWTVTSGRTGRWQRIYQVPEKFWDQIKTRKYKSGIVDADGNIEQIELRWDGAQSVVTGAHPTTTGYSWVDGLSPADLDIAEAPSCLLERMLRSAPTVTAAAVSRRQSLPTSADDATRARSYLAALSPSRADDYDDWLAIGMALHSIGDESLLADWDQWSAQSGKYAADTCRDKWRSFNNTGVTLGTLGGFAKRDGWRPAPKQQQVLPPTPSQPIPPGTPGTPPAAPAPQRPFELLGFSHGTYYYQPHSTAQVTPLLRSAHTGTNLTALAPLLYWQQMYASRRSVDWAAAASDLFEQQALKGMYSPERLRGRGAWWDKGRSIIHLGDRILVDNNEEALHGVGSHYHYQRGEALHGFDGITPITADEGLGILHVAAQFLWEQKPSAQLLAGWIALAPISGALKWRPHVWLTAPAGAGKSTILDRFVGPLLADFAQVFVGNSTEAGIRQQLRSDALPVVLDEAESNEKSDQARIQSILSLARVSSSESSASIIKGSSTGETARFRARSMFMFSSISTSLKQGADRRRFAQLTLQSAAAAAVPDAQAQWDALDQNLDRLVSPEIGRRLIARTVSMIPKIRKTIAILTAVAAKKFDSQALGDQYGTLMAGAWSLQSDSVPSDAQAHELIDLIDWSEYQQATEIPDERRCLDAILQQPIRVETDDRVHTRTILELIQTVQTPNAKPFEPITTEIAAAHLGRHGLQVKDGLLLVANNSKALTKLLAETAWQHSYPTVLKRLSGAAAAGSHHFRGVGQHRAIAVPLKTL